LDPDSGLIAYDKWLLLIPSPLVATASQLVNPAVMTGNLEGEIGTHLCNEAH